jgi:hypothetical protein
MFSRIPDRPPGRSPLAPLLPERGARAARVRVPRGRSPSGDPTMPRITRCLLLGALLLAAACERAPTTASDASPTPLPVPGAPSAVFVGDTTRATDFSEHAAGAQPAGWTQMWDPTPHFVVADEAAGTGGRVLQWSATGQSRNRWALAYDGFGDRTDQAVYTELRVRSLGGGASVYYMGAAAVRIAGTASDERGYAAYLVTVPSTGAKSVVLATFAQGAYVQLGSYTMDWELDQWYALRLEAVGTTVRARIWPRGTAEPAVWQLSATDLRYPSGRPGVSHHDNGTVQWDVWQAAVSAAAPPPPQTITTFTAFTGGPAWIAPGGWTETSAPENSAWTISADLSFNDGRALRNVSTATGRHMLRPGSVPDTARDQEGLVKLRMAVSNDRGPGLALRHSMGSSGATAYVAYFRPGMDRVEINRFLNGSWMFLGSAAFPNDPGAWYWMRFRTEGTTLRLRTWADGQPEPAAWMVTATDAGIAAGAAALYTYEPNTVDYDLGSFASGGLTAPVPTPGAAPVLGLVRATPDSARVARGTQVQMRAHGRTTTGDSVALAVLWSASGGSVDAAGLYTAPSSTGTYTVTATHAGTGLYDVSTITVADLPPVSGDSLVSTGFTLMPVNAPPPATTITSAPAGVDWRVADAAWPGDGRVLRATVTTTGRHIIRSNGLDTLATDQEALTLLRMADDDSRGPGLALRHSMNGSLETAYVAYFRPAGNTVEVNRFLNGAWSFVGSAAFANDPGVSYWMRFRAEGTTLRVRVWADGTPEPETWTIVATDGGIASGGVGVYAYEPNVVEFDGFSAVAGHGTAPTP